MHVAELAKISVTYRALSHFFFGTVLLLGKTECGVASSAESRRLRMLTPSLKAFAAERATGAMEDCMAACGGMGYMEEMGIGRCVSRVCPVDAVLKFVLFFLVI
jgi:alkylation response protein AidB-like acyl-CoA dehydrogenase